MRQLLGRWLDGVLEDEYGRAGRCPADEVDVNVVLWHFLANSLAITGQLVRKPVGLSTGNNADPTPPVLDAITN